MTNKVSSLLVPTAHHTQTVGTSRAENRIEKLAVGVFLESPEGKEDVDEPIAVSFRHAACVIVQRLDTNFCGRSWIDAHLHECDHGTHTLSLRPCLCNIFRHFRQVSNKTRAPLYQSTPAFSLGQVHVTNFLDLDSQLTSIERREYSSLKSNLTKLIVRVNLTAQLNKAVSPVQNRVHVYVPFGRASKLACPFGTCITRILKNSTRRFPGCSIPRHSRTVYERLTKRIGQ